MREWKRVKDGEISLPEEIVRLGSVRADKFSLVRLYDEFECRAARADQRWLGTGYASPLNCAHAVMSDPKCNHQYFYMASHGDRNCGCIGTLDVDCTNTTYKRPDPRMVTIKIERDFNI